MRALLVAALLAAPATAKIVATTPQGFELSETVTIAAPADRVFAALGNIGGWWDPAHSYSGKGENLNLAMRAGGCFCESLDGGGSVEHMRVVQAAPGRLLRLRGGLGPLQGQGADGALDWTLKPVAGGVALTQRYVVGGYLRPEPATLAPLVDGVLSGQLARLKRYVETGRPEPR